MSTSYSHVYGIDVSKDTLDICVLSQGRQRFEQITNDKPSILAWLAGLVKSQSYCVLEYTGTYSSQLIYLLSSHGVALSVVNPHQSSHFIKTLGVVNKNDKNAAQALALLGNSLDLPLYVMEPNSRQKRKQVLSSLSALKKQRQMLRNQLHALSFQVIINTTVKQAFEATLQTVNEQIQLLEQELDELSDEEHEKLMKKITSVVGIGPKTAQALLTVTGGLNHFEHDRQLAKFIGIVPVSHHSGTSVRFRGPITKKGNAELRACLYMAARSARRFNFACKDLYERLRSRGKSHKQAMVAVMNKLIRQVFAVIKYDRVFDNRYYLKYKSA